MSHLPANFPSLQVQKLPLVNKNIAHLYSSSTVTAFLVTFLLNDFCTCKKAPHSELNQTS